VNAGGSGGQVNFGTPGGESGMSIAGTDRADVRFDGTTLKLLAGTGPGAMASTNGINIDRSGNVGVGTDTPQNKFVVSAGGSGGLVNFGTPSGESGMAIIGTNRADVRFDGTTQKLLAGTGPGAMASTNGINIDRSGNVGIGTVTPRAKLDIVGNATQDLGSNGLVKAMALIAANNTVVRCYNSTATGTAVTAPPCGFNAVFEPDGPGTGFVVDFGFNVNNRFISVTLHPGLNEPGTAAGVSTYLGYSLQGINQINPNKTRVLMNGDVGTNYYPRVGFFIFIY